MANTSGNAYALTLLCPIQSGYPSQCPEGMQEQSCAALIRYELQKLRVSEESPMARVPNTYLSRLFVLDDVPYQGKPANLEHLKSNYLVFCADFYGELDDYLKGMWTNAKVEIQAILRRCYGFESVQDEKTFIEYVRKCQVTTTFFFNGSTDQPLAEQLKGLYLKQEFSKFAFANQGRSPAQIQAAFAEFVRYTEPENVQRPTWKAGAYRLDRVVSGESVK
ncbi:MAG: hypothetical protein WKF37_04895 [Bryobacteraceae bacterium]